MTKLADDRAEQLKRDIDKVVHELNTRLREDLRVMKDFSRIHPMPHSCQDVPDDPDAQLVALGMDYLPRLKSPTVLISAIHSGLVLITWEKDSFTYAVSFEKVVRGQNLRILTGSPTIFINLGGDVCTQG